MLPGSQNPPAAPGTGTAGPAGPTNQGPNDVIPPTQPGTGGAGDGQRQEPPAGQPTDFDRYRENSETRITTLMRQRDEATRLLEEEKRKGLDPKEIERLRALDDKDKARDQRERALILRYEVASRAARLNIVDPELAVMLVEKNTNVTVGEDGTVTGIDEALKALIKERPHLVRAAGPADPGAGTAGSPGSGGAPKKSMNDLIRGKVRGESA